MTARKLALLVLSRCETGGYSNLALDSALKTAELSDADRALAARLVFGVISKKLTLDYYISSLSSLPDNKIEPQTRNILRLGLYQLIYLDRIPPHAAVNESVALAPRRSAGFVNALLRSWQRKGGSIELPDDEIAAMSVRHSVSAELCERLIADYGFTEADAILTATDNQPPLTLRVNTLKITCDGLLKLFAEAGIEAVAGRLSPYAVCLEAGAVTRLPGFDDGLFFVQDEASQLATAALGVKAGEFAADVCSAPGSKAFGLAISMQNRGRILAFDLHASKLSLIRSGAERLGIDIIEVAAADSRQFLPELEGKLDAVLCDVPCSGFGVIAKKPEIRYKSLEEASALPEIQLSILENCSRYVKPQGAIVYSTCTLLSAENHDIAEKFLSKHKEFIPEALVLDGKAYHPSELRLLPHTHGCDGFFIAKFRRIR